MSRPTDFTNAAINTASSPATSSRSTIARQHLSSLSGEEVVEKRPLRRKERDEDDLDSEEDEMRHRPHGRTDEWAPEHAMFDSEPFSGPEAASTRLRSKKAAGRKRRARWKDGSGQEGRGRFFMRGVRPPLRVTSAIIRPVASASGAITRSTLRAAAGIVTDLIPDRAGRFVFATAKLPKSHLFDEVIAPLCAPIWAFNRTRAQFIKGRYGRRVKAEKVRKERQARGHNWRTDLSHRVKQLKSSVRKTADVIKRKVGQCKDIAVATVELFDDVIDRAPQFGEVSNQACADLAWDATCFAAEVAVDAADVAIDKAVKGARIAADVASVVGPAVADIAVAGAYKSGREIEGLAAASVWLGLKAYDAVRPLWELPHESFTYVMRDMLGHRKSTSWLLQKPSSSISAMWIDRHCSRRVEVRRARLDYLYKYGLQPANDVEHFAMWVDLVRWRGEMTYWWYTITHDHWAVRGRHGWYLEPFTPRDGNRRRMMEVHPWTRETVQEIVDEYRAQRWW